MICAILLATWTSPEIEAQAMLDALREKHAFVGATAALSVDGEIVAAVASGARKSGEDEAIRVEDPMHAGSNTKSMTVRVVESLVREGKLRWDMPISEALGIDAPDVALREFAMQRIPLPEPSPHAPDYRGDLLAMRRKYARDYLSGTPTGAFAEQFSYQNANFIVLGAVIEHVTGKPWEDAMRERLFGPLGLKTAGFGAIGRLEDLSEPWQHTGKPGEYQPVRLDNPPLLGPAGTVHLSVLDLVRYAQTWSAEEFTPLRTPPPGSPYAYGLVVQGDTYWHNGSNTLSFSVWRASRRGRVIAAVMLNCADEDAAMEAIRGLEALVKD